MNKKLVQINVVCNGSTGRIMTQIQQKAIEEGWEAYSFYGRGKPANEYCYKIGNKLEILWHVFLTRIFDKHGHGSKRATKKMIKQIEQINPDVIQLHNIHGYYIHLETLFNYLKKSDKKIVWTLHDCWAFTGHCTYFTCPKCDKWKIGCNNCIRKRDYPSCWFKDRAQKEYGTKKKMFTGIDNLTIVTPSEWLANLVKQSFLNEYKIKVINNGIDLNIFKPTNTIDVREKYNIQLDKQIILGVAAIWDKRKGLEEFIELSKYIDDRYKIVLVGLNKKQIKQLPKNIIGIKRTENLEELANLYTCSDVLFNPSKEETFSLITIEAIACGTPVIAYDNSAVKELINKETGICLPINLNKQENIKKILTYLEISKKIDNIDYIDKYSIGNMTSQYINTYEKRYLLFIARKEQEIGKNF